MFLAYYDESGDDGFPKYSSPFFVLSATYLYYLDWKDVFKTIHNFRLELKKDYGFPVKWELHTREFILNKNPYRNLSISDEDRLSIIDLFCSLIGQVEFRIVNVVINKGSITSSKYNVLDKALTYSIQRIENDLVKIDPSKKFILISDPGRIGKMRQTARKIQKINYIPSKYNPNPYRQEIKSLIEDPLEKPSKESFFIQVSDLVACIVYLYASSRVKNPLPKRFPKQVDELQILKWMDLLKDSFNLDASSSNPYGIVWHPP